MGMWRIEAKECFKGGPLSWDVPIRLKHLSSGMYLCIKSLSAMGDVKNLEYCKLTLERQLTPDSLFYLMNRESENDDQNNKFAINSDAFFTLVNLSTGI